MEISDQVIKTLEQSARRLIKLNVINVDPVINVTNKYLTTVAILLY